MPPAALCLFIVVLLCFSLCVAAAPQLRERKKMEHVGRSVACGDRLAGWVRFLTFAGESTIFRENVNKGTAAYFIEVNLPFLPYRYDPAMNIFGVHAFMNAWWS